ncbi:hypothetical protein PC128_g236 [Phytophthora cactorum]|nr:hypothetical protein PC120_g1115 [Phytophthora cactorum]KAG3096526.1 hypothetical protein PC121_g2487 [Phytophthora cactorum]KAG3207250.1 hypothetical protein PC128_g236 [Phytophthora cactorum]KAG4064441.1 hypothetical protein PC123_g742 [Phytophthora cactorum]
MDTAATEIERLRRLIGTYPNSNVYMDETEFYYDNVPRGSMCIHQAPALKQSKARITLVVCTNTTDSHKLSLLFIGKSKTPHWIKDKPTDVIYKSTAKAWMKTHTFQEWLLDLDKMMRGQDKPNFTSTWQCFVSLSRRSCTN